MSKMNIKYRLSLFSLFCISICITSIGCSRSDNCLSKDKPRTEILITREFYQLSFNTQTKQPNWVLQKASKESFSAPIKEDMDDYYPDLEIPKDVQSSSSDYLESKFVMSSLLFPVTKAEASPEELRYQYFFSVTCPQNPEFHQGYWKKLRKRVKEVSDEWNRNVLVLSGPLFLPDRGQTTYSVIGSNQIPVPTHFFQVIFQTMDLDKAEAYIVPNQKIDVHLPLGSFEVSLTEFRRRSGVLLPENMSDYFSPPIPPRM